MRTIIACLKERAEKSPEKIAFCDAEGQLTFSELADWSNRCAKKILQYKTTDTLRVMVHIHRSRNIAIAYYGIARSGATYVPVDLSFPLERIKAIEEDAGIQLVITERELADKFDPAIKRIFIEDLYQEEKVTEDIDFCDNEKEGMIFYTSGSTGKPKGVVHKAQLAAILSAPWIEQTRNQHNGVIGFYSNFAFVFSAVGLYKTVTYGLTAYVFNDEERLSIDNLEASIEQHHITIVHVPGRVLNQLLEDYPDTGIRVACIGGEKFYLKADTDVTIFETYGMTEADCVMCREIGPNDSDKLLGILEDHADGFLIDENGMKITKENQPGEFCIGGQSLAMGYHNCSDEMRNRFFIGDNGKRYFRTGDILSKNSDGSYNFHGRSGAILKVNGNRVELGEVEHALTQSQQIKDAICTVATEDEKDIIVCYYTLQDNVKYLHLNALRDHLSAILMPYMLPNVYVPMEKLPQNANGKADRKHLPEYDFLRKKVKEIILSTDYVLKADVKRTVIDQTPGYQVNVILTESAKADDKFSLEQLTEQVLTALSVPGLKIALKNQDEVNNSTNVSESEREVLAAFSKVAPELAFTVEDDLIEVGITSLQVVAAVAECERKLHKKIKASDVYHYKNIRDILNASDSIAYFYDGYDKKLPTLVFVSGIVFLNTTMPKCKEWRKHFNILLIEPIDDHYHELFKGKSYDYVMNYYFKLVVELVHKPENVFCFMGFSYGGTIAYQLACRWEHKYGYRISVVAGDSLMSVKGSRAFHVVLKRSYMPVLLKLVLMLIPLDEVLAEANNIFDGVNIDINNVHLDQKKPTRELLKDLSALLPIDIMFDKFQICSELDATDKIIRPYKGKVFYINAEKSVPKLLTLVKLRKARRCFKNMSIANVPDATHFDLFVNQKYLPRYTKLLLKLKDRHAKQVRRTNMQGMQSRHSEQVRRTGAQRNKEAE